MCWFIKCIDICFKVPFICGWNETIQPSSGILCVSMWVVVSALWSLLLSQFGQPEVVPHSLQQIGAAQHIHSCHSQSLGRPQGVQLGLLGSWRRKENKTLKIEITTWHGRELYWVHFYSQKPIVLFNYDFLFV